MDIADTAEPNIATLNERTRGTVVAPGGADWDASRQAFNLAIDQRPAAVAYPADAIDVANVLGFAAANRLQVAPQRTGHAAAALDSVQGAILLKTDALGGVEIDREARRARVGAGAQWKDVVPEASPLGLAPLHGTAPGVGIVGYTLGGGLGWYGRAHGLAANAVTAIDVVTGDGRALRADRDNEPDLFWALRGGGGDFGVVTAIEFDLFAVASLYAGALFFPMERAAEVLHEWRDWVRGVPDELSSIGRLLRFPPIPEIPEPLRGNSFALVEAVYLGDEAEGAELMRPLRELGPAMDTFAIVPPVGLGELHMDPPEPGPAASAHALLGDLPAQAVDDLLAVTGPDSGSPLVSVEVRHLGGALARGGDDHGAIDRVDASFALFAVGVLMDPAMEAPVRERLGMLTDAMAPYDAGRFYNFTDVPETEPRFYPAETYERLRAVKAKYDPDGVIRACHGVGG